MTRKNILLVDDEAIIALDTARRLTDAGYVVATVCSGEQAVAFVQDENPVDLVLMDIDLGPGIDGTEAAREILALRDVPVVFLTSHAERELVERTRRITRYGYILKSSGDFVLTSSVEMAFELFEAYHQLRHREAYLCAILENLPGLAWLKDTQSRLLAVNTAYAVAFGFMSPDQVVGKTDLDLAPYELAEKYRSDDRKVMETGKPLMVEEPILDRGPAIWHETFKTPVRDETGVIIGTAGYAHNITERKRFEDALRAERDKLKASECKLEHALKEKELMLREVHHRIKNNMSSIASLLSLQAGLLDDASACAALREAHTRVLGMVRIYDKLYLSRDFDRLDMSEYLRELVTDISNTAFTGDGRISVVCDLEPVVVNARCAFPLGIIVSELLSNAFKYAFPDGRSGNVVVIFKRIGEKEVRLTVSDDGIGAAPDVIRTAGGFGLGLVEALSRQIGGCAQWNTEGGTMFSITFSNWQVPCP